jgi:hypothetical protein
VPGACEAIADESSCAATQDCAWVEVTTVQAGGDFCGVQDPRGECVSTFYQGEGCATYPICGVDSDQGAVYARAIDEQTWDVIENSGHSFCENQPVGFETCAWDLDGTVTSGPPAACACICGDLIPPASLPPNVEDELSGQGGCADVTLYAYDELGTVALSFYVDGGYADQAVDSMMPVDVELTAGDDAEVKLHLGSQLQNTFCTDVGGQGETDATWTAVAGSLSLHIEPVDGQPFASLTLTNVEFMADDPFAAGGYSIDSYTFTDVLVGWLPG